MARTDEGEVRYASVFREHWRDRQSAATRTGELITQPGWIDAGIAALCALLAAGTLAAGTITLARTEALPAVAQGASVSAVRTGGSPLADGAAAARCDIGGRTPSSRGTPTADQRAAAEAVVMRRRGAIPYIAQAEMADCGAAALAMALAYHGRHVSLASGYGSSTTRTGVSFRSVSPRKNAGCAARITSMNTTPITISPSPRISTSPTPPMLAPLP